MGATQRELPPMPRVGLPESSYAHLVRHADRAGDIHAREAAKIGQYVTLALAPDLLWEQKLRYFRHALRRHCVPPPLPSEEIWLFYRSLANFVREHAGREALRLAILEDDLYARRLRMGSTPERISSEAESFFSQLTGLGETCPEHFTHEDWDQLKLIRDQWV